MTAFSIKFGKNNFQVYFEHEDASYAEKHSIPTVGSDFIYGNMHNIDDRPEKVIERLRRYFLTCKDAPQRGPHSKIQFEPYSWLRRSLRRYHPTQALMPGTRLWTFCIFTSHSP